MTTDDPMRAFARAIFARALDEEQTEGEQTDHPEPARGNVVPSEGQNPTPPDPQLDMRQFVQNLFHANHI